MPAMRIAPWPEDRTCGVMSASRPTIRPPIAGRSAGITRSPNCSERRAVGEKQDARECENAGDRRASEKRDDQDRKDRDEWVDFEVLDVIRELIAHHKLFTEAK